MTGPEFAGGESKAHKEIENEYKIKFRRIIKNGFPPHIQTIYLVENICN